MARVGNTNDPWEHVCASVKTRTGKDETITAQATNAVIIRKK